MQQMRLEKISISDLQFSKSYNYIYYHVRWHRVSYCMWHLFTVYVNIPLWWGRLPIRVIVYLNISQIFEDYWTSELWRAVTFMNMRRVLVMLKIILISAWRTAYQLAQTQNTNKSELKWVLYKIIALIPFFSLTELRYRKKFKLKKRGH